MQVCRLAFQLCKSYDLPMTQAAVLTGDLIGSTEAGPEATQHAIDALNHAAKDVSVFGLAEPMRFTRWRGDGWQAIVTPPNRFFRSATYLLARLRSADTGLQTRIGIGIGAVEAIDSDDLSSATGQAFTYSGHALDQMAAQERIAICGLPTENLAWCQAALETLNYMSGRWSREQSEAMVFRLYYGPAPLFHIARTLNISRQALSSRLAVAGEKPIMAAIRAAEATL
jgi:hypothetical protein